MFAFSVPSLLIVANNYCIILAMYLDPEMLCVVNWPCRRNVLILLILLVVLYPVYVAFGDNLRLFSCAAMAAPNLPWLIATSLPAHTTKPVEQLVL